MGSRALNLKLQEAERELARLKQNAEYLQNSVLRLEQKIGAIQRALDGTKDEPTESRSTPPPLPPKQGTPPDSEEEVVGAIEFPEDPDVAASETEPDPPLPEETIVGAQENEPPSASTPHEFSSPEPAQEPQEALEMRFGRVWFVRIGIGLVLTGFVFLSTYTYKNYIAELGPGARVAALLTGALLLTAIGIILERWSESLRNYGRVVTAGGGAAVYYTTYAAHHIEHLRIIESPVMAAVILSLVALAFFAYAASRRSSVLTVGALVLAFYATAINPTGWLGCFSSLLLSGIGVFFFLRCGWVRTGITGLLGSYLSYAYWQGLVAETPTDDFTRWFLVGYWILFTCSFLSPAATRFSPRERNYLVAHNNFLFFALFSLNLQTGTFVDHLGTITLVFGSVLLGVALWITSKPASYPRALRDLYLVKGLTLLTWGITLELSGYWLFLTLTLEATALAFLHKRTNTPLLRYFAWIATLIGILFALYTLDSRDEFAPIPLYLLQGLLLVGIAYFLRGKPYLDHPNERFSLESTLAAGAALALPITSLHYDFSVSSIGLILMGLSVALFLPYLRLGEKFPIPELSWLAQAGGLLGALMLLSNAPPTWQIGLGCALAVSALLLHGFFQDRKVIPPLQGFSLGSEYAFTAVAVVSLGMLIYEVAPGNEVYFLALSALPLLGHVIGCKLSRLPTSQLPLGYYAVTLVISINSWIASTGAETLSSPFVLTNQWALLAAILLVVTHLASVHTLSFLANPRVQEFLLAFAGVLWIGWCVTFLSMWWLVLAWTGFALILVTFSNKAQVPTAVTILLFGLLGALAQEGDYWYRYLVLPAPILIHLIGSRRTPIPGEDEESPPPDFWPALAIGVAFIWTFIVSQHTLDAFDGDGLAVCWALLGLALFGLGLALRVRAYRLSGLALLALCLGHVLFIDVWELDPVPRIISFLTLGLALLALGFVYNRWQETLRKLL